MRYAIVSDIHANRQAWEAILADMEKIGVDTVLCLGDVIGYGPEPSRVLESAYKHCSNFVLGNHDAVVGGRLDPDLFNDEARVVIDWTCEQLNDDVAKFFSVMPMSMSDEDFLCVHAEAANPERFGYIDTPELALESIMSCTERLTFVGHTHLPSVYAMQEGVMVPQATADFNIAPDMRYLVNVGSVGDPRDGDKRASYVIYDQQQNTVHFRRIDFDYDAYGTALAATKIPIKPFFLTIHEESASKEPAALLTDMQPIKKFTPRQTSSTKRTVKIKIKKQTSSTRDFADFALTQKTYKTGKALKFVSTIVVLLLLGGLFWITSVKQPQQVTAPLSPNQPRDTDPEQQDTDHEQQDTDPEQPQFVEPEPKDTQALKPTVDELTTNLKTTYTEVGELVEAVKAYSKKTEKTVFILLSKKRSYAIGLFLDEDEKFAIPGIREIAFQAHITIAKDITISYLHAEGFKENYKVFFVSPLDPTVMQKVTMSKIKKQIPEAVKAKPVAKAKPAAKAKPGAVKPKREPIEGQGIEVLYAKWRETNLKMKLKKKKGRKKLVNIKVDVKIRTLLKNGNTELKFPVNAKTLAQPAAKVKMELVLYYYMDGSKKIERLVFLDGGSVNIISKYAAGPNIAKVEKPNETAKAENSAKIEKPDLPTLYRKWKPKKAKPVEAKLLGFNGEKFLFSKTSSRKILKIKLSSLIKEDQDLIRSWQKQGFRTWTKDLDTDSAFFFAKYSNKSDKKAYFLEPGIDVKRPFSLSKLSTDTRDIITEMPNWISQNAKYTISSGSSSPCLLNDAPTETKGFSFHTKMETNPWIIIDLGEKRKMNSFQIINHPKEPHRAGTLTIWISNDEKDWKEIWQAEAAKKKWEFKLPIAKTARYVKLGLQAKHSFHLNKVKILDE
ncbi:MAG: metallophosphoesterase family protein [Lentisphaeria bacterium]|nr:metallophosphoesterase family protein [Lentisphaeria bacterium]